MADQQVINTGPLVTLARADLLELLGKLPVEFVCPQEVMREIDAGLGRGYPNAKPEWVRSMALKEPLSIIAMTTLDVGEAAVIQLALEQGIPRVCMDDRKGRLAAKAMGLKVTGTLGLLARAKVLGLVPALRPLIDKVKTTGAFYSEQVVQDVLKSVGEQKLS